MTSDQTVSPQFMRALDAAVTDVVLETQLKSCVQFYADADFIIGTFYDRNKVMDAMQADANSDLSDRVIARCLWAAGFTGPLKMLWPHRSEVIRTIDLSFGVVESSDTLKELLEVAKSIFSKKPGTEDKPRLDKAEQSEEERLESIAKSIKLKHLAIIVSSFDNWGDRLHLIGDNINFDSTIDADEFQRILSISRTTIGTISRNIQLQRASYGAVIFNKVLGMQPPIEANSHRDACALVELNAIASVNKLIRFVSDTAPLSRVVAKDAGERLPLLCPPLAAHDGLDHGPVDRPTGVLRSSTYIVLRSCIPALYFVDRREATKFDIESSMTLTALSQCLETYRNVSTADKRSPITLKDKQSTLEQVTKILRSVLDTSGFLSVWANSESEAIKAISKQSEIINTKPFEMVEREKSFIERAASAWGRWKQSSAHNAYEKALALSDATRVAIVESRVAAVQDAERLPKGQFNIDEQLCVDALQHGGIGRWLALLLPDAGSASELYHNAFYLISREASDRSLNDLGSRVREVIQAAAPLAMRNSDRKMIAVLNSLVRFPQSNGDNDILVKLILLILRQCKDLKRAKGTTKKLADFINETADIEKSVENISEYNKKCIRAMAAWRTFYWCYSQVGISIKHNADVRREAERSLDILETSPIVGNQNFAREVLLSASVRAMLSTYVKPSQRFELGDVDWLNPYDVYAYAWSVVRSGEMNRDQISFVKLAYQKMCEWPAGENFFKDIYEYVGPRIRAVSIALNNV